MRLHTNLIAISSDLRHFSPCAPRHRMNLAGNQAPVPPITFCGNQAEYP
jgi:hypothetical protein